MTLNATVAAFMLGFVVGWAGATCFFVALAWHLGRRARASRNTGDDAGSMASG